MFYANRRSSYYYDYEEPVTVATPMEIYDEARMLTRMYLELEAEEEQRRKEEREREGK